MRERLQGIGASAGVAIGTAYLIRPHEDPIVPEPIPPERVEEERARLEAARQQASADLQRLRERIRDAVGDAYAGILDAQLLILDDPGLVAETEQHIRVGRVSAGYALKQAFGRYRRAFDAVDDEYLRERGNDLDDVYRRMQGLLRAERRRTVPPPTGPVIVVAHSLGPSDALALELHDVVGLATDAGGRTSHTAILAQALSIPAVVGLHDASCRIAPGDPLIVDGETGELLIDPDEEQIAGAVERRELFVRREAAMASARDLPSTTADGLEVELRANIEFPEEVAKARRYGAHGIGLYRSEFLFLTHSPEFPDEEQHYVTYRSIGEGVAPHPAVIRTLDLGGEKYYHDVLERRDELNPVLGLRGIRLCLARPDVFRPQLRGLLRAAAEVDLRVIVPLVTHGEQIRSVRRMLEEEANDLRANGIPVGSELPIGAMIEVPAAALTADTLARDCDFLSIGTNDLIQYALAVDRGNDALQHLYQPTHPAVLRMLDFVVRSAANAGIPVSLCGEMAADPRLLPLLIGVGLREFSVQPVAVAPLREAVRGCSAERCREMTERAMQAGTADEVDELLREQSASAAES